MRKKLNELKFASQPNDQVFELLIKQTHHKDYIWTQLDEKLFLKKSLLPLITYEGLEGFCRTLISKNLLKQQGDLAIINGKLGMFEQSLQKPVTYKTT